MLWLVAALAPVLVAVRCGQIGLPGRGLVLSQLLLAGWLVAVGATRLVSSPEPRFDAFAAVLVSAVGCLAVQRLEGVSPERWKRLGSASTGFVLLSLVACLIPIEGPRGVHGLLGVIATVAVASLASSTLISVAPRIRRSQGDLAIGVAGVLFALPALVAGFGLVAGPEALFEPLSFLPGALFLGWLMAPAGSPMRRASDSIDPVLVVEFGAVVDGNDSAYKLFGASLGDLHALRRAVHAVSDLRHMIVEEERECGEFFLGNAVASRQCFEVRVEHAANSDSGMRVLTLQNATARKASERRLYHQAHFDSLTGLANRRYFVNRLGEALGSGGGGSRVALLCLDLDRFKEINDTYGHAAGDELLRIVGHRLRQHLRLEDCLTSRDRMAAPSIARLGGDEFAILLPGIGDREDVGRVAERVLKLVSEPVTLKGCKLWVAGSVGIAFYPEDGTTLETLCRHADIALYQAKSERRSHFQFFDHALNVASQRKASLDRQLRGAIEEGELTLHFQPKVTTEGEEIRGGEALLRWNSAEHGPVPPKEFIPVAEEFGLIGALGGWVLDSACAQLAAWRAQDLEIVPISVNVSPFQFRQMNLLESVGEALERHRIDPSLLEIELTESAVLEEGDAAIECLGQLRTIGVRVALDDFGTGYSALSYLSSVPLDVLKLDRKFIRDIHLDPAAEGVVAGVVSMAHSLGLTVVAEGVDCEEQIESLARAGCDLIQGFVFGPGVAANEFGDMLEWGLYGKPQPDAPDFSEEADAAMDADIDAVLPARADREGASYAHARLSEKLALPEPKPAEDSAPQESDDEAFEFALEVEDGRPREPQEEPPTQVLGLDPEPAAEVEARAGSEPDHDDARASEEREDTAVAESEAEEGGAADREEVADTSQDPAVAGEAVEAETASEEASDAAEIPESLAAASAGEASEGESPREAPKDDEARVLIVGHEDEDLGLLALRLNRLGVVALYAHDAEEALQYAAEDGRRIGGLVVAYEIESEPLARLVERASSEGCDVSLVFVGGEPSKGLRELAGPAAVWVLDGPMMDPELRMVFESVLTPLAVRAQRAWTRAAYDVMAHMEVSGERRSGVLASLSEVGCFIACTPVPEGSLLDLEFTLEDGPVDVVGKVIYALGEESHEGAGIGVEFLGVTRDLEQRLAASIAERGGRCLA